MTKYIKKEDFERMIETSIDTVGDSVTESIIIKLLICMVAALFGALFVAAGLILFIGFIAVLLAAVIVSGPFILAEIVIRKKL